ncbi:hypothetical protein Q1695_013035 [Nippostrongylus brasiliensis]|nr:hypothetical protein Q1695_013035 [Nippostrongylus brasiliensis]
MYINRPSQTWTLRREAMATLYWIAAIITLTLAGQMTVEEQDSSEQSGNFGASEGSERDGDFGTSEKSNDPASVIYKRRNGQTIQHTVVLDSEIDWYKAQIHYAYRRVSKCSVCKGVLWAGAQRFNNSNDFEWLFDTIGNVTNWLAEPKFDKSEDRSCLGLWIEYSKFAEKQCIDWFIRSKASDFQQELMI